MNVSQITMPVEEAKAKLDAYRERLRRRADAEYEAAAAGYEAIAAGTPLLDLPEAIRGGGFDDQMRPRLAVARADRRQVMFCWRHYETRGIFRSGKLAGRHYVSAASTRQPTLNLSIDFGRQHGQRVTFDNGGGYSKSVVGYALVPMIPADVRPEGKEKDWFILWEVEQWSREPLLAVPDRDPYLLKHVGGDLYAILAEWDLTDLERAVMAGRVNS